MRSTKRSRGKSRPTSSGLQRKLTSESDLRAILDLWNDAIETLPHHRTVGPLIRATALAAHGLTDRARGVLERAERGLAWENALEHRLLRAMLESQTRQAG